MQLLHSLAPGSKLPPFRQQQGRLGREVSPPPTWGHLAAIAAGILCRWTVCCVVQSSSLEAQISRGKASRVPNEAGRWGQTGTPAAAHSLTQLRAVLVREGRLYRRL